MNKKKIVVISLLLICAINCFATIIAPRFQITESEEEFDVIYYLTNDMTVLENKENDDVSVTQTFLINRNEIQAEVRYSLFTDTGNNENDLQLQFAMWVFMCINNAAGYEVPANEITSFKDSDVKKEFNGDFGCTAFLQDPKSNYAEGYKYMMVEFFCKKNQGIVMRTFLFNDVAFVGINEKGQLSPDSIWLANYHTFAFMEKDENGKFIHD